VAAPLGLALDPGFVSLAALPPGTTGRVVSVGSAAAALSPLERRLLEFGFVNGEQVEILAEARPGRDPFVVRVGHTTLARGRHATEPAPDLLVCVVDATNLRLSLRLVLELKRLGRPMIVALNMSDLAAQRGYTLDRAALERALGVPVVPTVAVRAGGERALV